MNFITPYQREKEIKKRAQEKLKDHQFTELVNNDEVQIYRCRDKSGSVVYGFDIILAPNCIAVSGDIGRVLYGVGRGLDFLAQYGCSHYGFEKLDSVYREKKETSAYLVAHRFYSGIFYRLAFDYIEKRPEPLKKPSDIEPEELQAALEELYATISRLYRNRNNLPKWMIEISAEEKDYESLYDLLRELREYNYEPDEQQLRDIILDNSWPEIDCDWWDYGYTQPDSCVMWVTACAEYAAGRILEQQKEAA